MIENIDMIENFEYDHLFLTSIHNFKKSEFENLINESKKIVYILNNLEKDKENIINNCDPKIIHLANQHLTVIQHNLKEQLFELKSLIKNLETHNIVKLEENNSYNKLCEDSAQFNHVFKIFLPYILICSIYLKINQNNNNRNNINRINNCNNNNININNNILLKN